MEHQLHEYKNYEPVFLPKARKEGYVCPACKKSGTGERGTGITSYRTPSGTIAYKCHACGFHGDTADLWAMHHYGLSNAAEMSAEGFAELEAYYFGSCARPTAASRPAEPKKPSADYTAYYAEAADEAEKSEEAQAYLRSRGISENLQAFFSIGFDAAWRHPKRTSGERLPHVIIPHACGNYSARDISGMASAKYGTVGSREPFGMEQARGFDTVWVVEGEFDALSLWEAGQPAIGLGGAQCARLLVEALEEGTLEPSRVIICPDKDEAGEKAAQDLKAALHTMGIAYTVADLGTFKDANDFLTADREGFIAWAAECAERIPDYQPEPTKDGRRAALDALDYFKNPEAHKAATEVRTGFRSLDRALYGGLHEGLHVIGAISAGGKTTFCLQLADQIAAQGQDVLFFSLEMSARELVAKSLSRFTFQRHRNATAANGKPLAKDTQRLLNTAMWRSYSERERAAIAEAVSRYEAEESRLFIHEGKRHGHRLTVKDIAEVVQEHVAETGNVPVIFVDYLQILAPLEGFRGTDKQATDAAVFELKDISRRYNAVVFAVSSFNRESYNEPVSLSSFKESGAIEYTADLLFGLQFLGMDRNGGESKDAYARRVKDIAAEAMNGKREGKPVAMELKCLKYRTGYNFKLALDLVHAYNCFMNDRDSNGGELEQITQALKDAPAFDLETLVAQKKSRR